MSVGGSSDSALSLEQLVALNDEMAALVRAGVPLEQGLVEVGEEMPGRIGDIAARIGQRLREGETLSQILAADERQFPPVWRAVVEAGIRSGRLSSALEGLSTTARRVAELRGSVAAAWVYPLAVITVAYGLFILFVTWIAPTMFVAIEGLEVRADMVGAFARLGRTVTWWGPLVPVCVAVCVVMWWRRAGDTAWRRRQTPRSVSRAFSFLHWPTIGGALRDGRLATFAEVLAMLLDHQTPLPSAIVLAADASGDPDLRDGARTIGQQLERGEVFTSRNQVPASFPPLVGWLLITGLQHRELSASLRTVANTYRKRAACAATWNATYLPLVLTALVGGSVVLLQALAIFVPIVRLLYALG